MTEIIGVRFRGGPKEYYFDPRGVAVAPGQYVIVETAAGQEYARCVSGNRTVEDAEIVPPLRPLVRLATENDRRTWELNRQREKSAFAVGLQKIAQHRLDMKLVKVEINFTGTKLVFYFTSEGRVDFRALVRDLASEFRARIELRQIGVRDEAKLLGGLGICGRAFCCCEFLDDFIPVSIKMAKTQSLSLNPTMISGACGRLMCCLKYEQEAYEDAVRRCPKPDSFVLTPDGPGNVTSVNILREQAVVRLDEQPDSPKRYRSCELNVLRSGKGSREGIEIPRERPARYRAPEELAAEIEATRIPDYDAILDAEAEEGARRRARRGGRGKRRQNADAAPRPDKPRFDKPAHTEKPPKTDGAKPPRPFKPRAEKPRPPQEDARLAADKSAVRRRQHRGGRGHRKGGAPGAPKPEA